MSRLLDIFANTCGAFRLYRGTGPGKNGKTEDLASTCVLYMAILDTGVRSDCVLNILLRLKAGPIRGAINCYLSA